MQMYIPLAVIVLSNIAYHVCSKATPERANPYAMLTVTYLVGAAVSAILYFVLNKGDNLLAEYKNLNWSAWALGISIVGLEVGTIYMYKVGWNIGTGQLIHGSVLAICLVVIGAVFYKEQVTLSKVAGIAVCLAGLYLINR